MDYQVVSPSGCWQRLQEMPVLLPFSTPAVDFANALSEELLNRRQRAPEVTALGYWLRGASIRRLNERFKAIEGENQRLARGVAFHVAPSNVDTIFVYSWLLSLLLGNSNVVRLPSAESALLSALIKTISGLLSLERFRTIRHRTLLVRYGHDQSVNDLFSEGCDLRLIWGGDETVKQIRRSPLPPVSRDICFTDKNSLAVLDAAAVNSAKTIDRLVAGFYNDAFGFGQMACSSPKLIVWKGGEEQILSAKKRFWEAVTRLADQRYPDIPLAVRIEKLVTQYSLAIDRSVRIERSESAFVNRILLDGSVEPPLDNHCGGGLFYEAHILDLVQLAPLVSPKTQTMTVFGLSSAEIRDFTRMSCCRGVDRVVAFGEALNFDAQWDGYNLLAELTREQVIGL